MDLLLLFISSSISPDHMSWLGAALSVSVSIAVMGFTKTTHPPGAAASLIAVLGSPELRDLGFLFILVPVLLGVAIMFSIAIGMDR